MAFNGSGVFARLYSWAADAAGSIAISSSRMDAEMDGMATGLSTCITKDGQQATTAQIPFAHGVGLNDGSAASPSLTFTADTDSGIYRIGANEVGLGVNGANVLDISTTGLTVNGALSVTGAVSGSSADGTPVGGRIIQRVEATPFATWSTSSVVGAFGDNKMQNTEGAQILSASITPKSSSNRLRILALVNCAPTANTATQIGLFQDSTAAALTQVHGGAATDVLQPLVLQHEMAAGTTSATTFAIRGASASGSIAFNGISSSRRGGGAMACRLMIEEYK